MHVVDIIYSLENRDCYMLIEKIESRLSIRTTISRQ